MSSALLFLAIVAIWACVLVPRWLRRDSARVAAAPASAETTVPGGSDSAVPEVIDVDAGLSSAPHGAPAHTSPARASAAQDSPARDSPAHTSPAHTSPAHDEPPRREQRRPVLLTRRPAAPASAAESRRRMMAVRRRLLGALILLEAAAFALAVLGLAAIWVVAPTSVMLVGYVLLLCEASQADAERARLLADAAARARSRSRARSEERERGTRAPRHPEEAAANSAAALAATLAAAPVPADSEDGPGRDFAPGLAGKYTTSYADQEPDLDENYGSYASSLEDYYGDYEEPRLRAVGD